MWQILHASFWKFSKLCNIGISLNWSIVDEVTTRNTTAYFFGPLCTFDGAPLNTSRRLEVCWQRSSEAKRKVFRLLSGVLDNNNTLVHLTGRQIDYGNSTWTQKLAKATAALTYSAMHEQEGTIQLFAAANC